MTSDRTPPDALLRRWRANLEAAGIAAPAGELDAVVAEGRLALLEGFERLGDPGDLEQLPDTFTPAAPAHAGSSSLEPHRLYGSVADAVGRAREADPVGWVEAALRVLAERDPQLNAFETVRGEPALAEARRRKVELDEGAVRGALHGVPVAVKSLFAVRGLPHTAGSRVRAGVVASHDSAVAAALEQAGAVILGTTRMSEYAYYPGSANPNDGPTRNPVDPTRDTGGSSSGSAAAVAAGIVRIAIGSDTGGSIRIPASACGVVGLKPTFGRISLHGAVPLSWSMDHAGPLAATVLDAARALEVLAGEDPLDPRTHGAPAPIAWSRVVDGPVAELRAGLVSDDGTPDPMGGEEARAAVRAAWASIDGAGASTREIGLPEMAPLRVLTYAILAMEAAAYHAPMLREQLSDYGEIARRRLLAAFAFGPESYVRAQRLRADLRRSASRVFEHVDVLITPTLPGGAELLGVPGSTDYTSPFNALGWPAITVPCGRTAQGLPLGVQIVAAPWAEEHILRAAYVVERAHPAAESRPGYRRRTTLLTS